MNSDKIVPLSAFAVPPSPMDPEPRSRGESVRRHLDRAFIAADEHVGDFLDLLVLAAEEARDIATGGAAYNQGVRDLCARLAPSLIAQIDTIRALRDRHPVSRKTQP